CHRGATTGTSCGTIESITHDPGSLCGPNRNGECASTWVRVTGPNLACSGGDSGGPWFNGGTAYGIHKSGASSGTGQGQCSRASFMSINYIGGLGLTTLKG
ncbi:MAG: S1 family peptidase, partial [Chloroflexota bacterium]|nr:S1 family peptidase [Chloroflexota bacterium]